MFAIVNLPYWGLICVGVCSGVYHMTLKYHTQMADEMSMHTAMGCVLIQIFTYEKTPTVQKQITYVVLGGLTAFIVYHCATDEFLLHVILFLSLSITVITKTYLMIRNTVKDQAQKEKLSTLATVGTGTRHPSTAGYNPLTICSVGRTRLLPLEHRHAFLLDTDSMEGEVWHASRYLA